MADESLNTGVTFIHLRSQSAYSLSEGALPIKQMTSLANAMGMPALAITDSGNLFGALEFSEALSDKSIQPIIGCTLKVDFRDTASDGGLRGQGVSQRLPGLALLAKDEAGYRNLTRLSSHAYLDAPDHAEPHVPLSLLAECAAGLICLTGGPGGPINEALAGLQPHLARQRLEQLKGLFGDRLYIELQRHGTDEERTTEDQLVDLAYEMD